MKSLRLPFNNRSPFRFRISHPVLTLCGRSMIIFIRVYLLLGFIIIKNLNYYWKSSTEIWFSKLSVFVEDLYKIFNLVFPEANVVFISQGGEESGSTSEDSSSNNSSDNNPDNEPNDDPNDADDDNDPNDADDDYDTNDNDDDDKSYSTVDTLDTKNTYDVLLWTSSLVRGGLDGDIEAIETAKEQFPDCFEGRSEREGLFKAIDEIEKDIKTYLEEQAEKQVFINDNSQSESEESSNIEEESESEEVVNEELKRKREDESSKDEPESKRSKTNKNDDDSGNSGSSGLGGSGDNGNSPPENSMGPSENSKSWTDIGILLLMFLSSIVENITLFLENLI